MTRLQTLNRNEWTRAHQPLKEDVVRRIGGDHTYTETVSMVVEIDTGAAGSQTSNGGLQQQKDVSQVERAGRVEVAASQALSSGDHLEIDGHGLWAVVGDAIGTDAGSKTYLIRNISRARGRQPNVNTKQ